MSVQTLSLHPKLLQLMFQFITPKESISKETLFLFHFVPKMKNLFWTLLAPISEPLSCACVCVCVCVCVYVCAWVTWCVCAWVCACTRLWNFWRDLSYLNLVIDFFLKSRKRIVLDKSWADVVRLQLLHKSRQQNTWKTSKNFQLKNVIR